MKQIRHVFHPGRSLGNFPALLEGLVNRTEKPIQVTVQEYKPPKTNSQNNYFHGVVVPTIAKALGKPVYVIRESLKLAFLPQVPSVVDPERWYPQSLADISKEQYSDLINESVAWAAGEGIIIPAPEDLRP